MRVCFFLLSLLWILASGLQADEPFRLQRAVGAPDWLKLRGESRTRHEVLTGQFRAGRRSDDELLLMRSLFQAEIDPGPVAVGVEFQDSRTYLADEDTPLTSSFANPLDFLQLYVRVDALPGLLGQGSSTQLVLGRQTVSIGSKRQIERVSYANVIKSYTGAHLISQNDRGDELHAFLVVPTARFPNTRPAVDRNQLKGDKEQWGRKIWGLHYRRSDILPTIAPDLWGELFIYGLSERDTERFQTPGRSYFAPGFRLYRRPVSGRWDIDIEAALRLGHRTATSDPLDTDRQSVNAASLFAALGYKFDAPWQPRLSLEYYYASGDKDPNDGRFNQHERLFGGRRTDLNNTSIHGPLTPANMSAPGLRLQLTPGKKWDSWIQYHAAYLASPTDTWVIAKLRDPTGASGRFIGHMIDARLRFHVIAKSLLLEIGASGLLYGGFPKRVPGGPRGKGTLFGYSQFVFTF